MTLPAHFWSKTARADCINWVGAQNSKGYGCFAIDGKSHLAHRLAWEDANGPIPDEMTIDHLCRNRACVNVDHLELVTAAENTRRARSLDLGETCRNGHEIRDESELYRRPNGSGVECRICRAAAMQRSKARRKEAA